MEIEMGYFKVCIPCSGGNHGHCALKNCSCPICESSLMKAYEFLTRQKRGNKANNPTSQKVDLPKTEKLNTTYKK
jgi:hypothetical protein